MSQVLQLSEDARTLKGGITMHFVFMLPKQRQGNRQILAELGVPKGDRFTLKLEYDGSLSFSYYDSSKKVVGASISSFMCDDYKEEHYYVRATAKEDAGKVFAKIVLDNDRFAEEIAPGNFPARIDGELRIGAGVDGANAAAKMWVGAISLHNQSLSEEEAAEFWGNWRKDLEVSKDKWGRI